MTTTDQPPYSVSIVTPSLNQGEFLAAAIESVISQEGDFYIDYVAMDGGSSDGSVDIIRRYDLLLNRDQSLVRCLGVNFRWSSKRDGGHADAVNTGLRGATGNILGFLNSDDLYEPGVFQHVLQCFHKHPAVDVVYGHALYVDEQNHVESMYPSFDVNKTSLMDGCWICQPATFMRTDTYRSTGEFRTDLIGFDYEYWMRLQRQNKTFFFTQRVLARSRDHSKTKRYQNKRAMFVEALELTRDGRGYNPTWRWEYTAKLTLPGRLAKFLSDFGQRIIYFLLVQSYSHIWPKMRYLRKKLNIDGGKRLG